MRRLQLAGFAPTSPWFDVVVQTFVGEMPEQRPAAEVRLGLLARGPGAAPIARRAGGRHAVDDAQALGRAEHAAAERADDRRIQQHDGAEQLRAAHRGEDS